MFLIVREQTLVETTKPSMYNTPTSGKIERNKNHKFHTLQNTEISENKQYCQSAAFKIALQV